PEQNCRVGASPYPPYKFVPVRTPHLTPLNYYPNSPFIYGRQDPQFVPQTTLTPTAGGVSYKNLKLAPNPVVCIYRLWAYH
ncbi:hypothetical protein, partial [Enterobacter intestinihominis]